jgi:hypothetical protein
MGAMSHRWGDSRRGQTGQAPDLTSATIGARLEKTTGELKPGASMLNRVLSASFLVVMAGNALGLEAAPTPQEAVVNFLADNPHAMLEVSSGRSSAQVRTTFGMGAASISSWTPLCYAPCRVSVRLVDELRVSGDGIQPSSPVLIDPGVKELNLRARTGSSGAHVAAVMLFFAAAGTAVVGGSLLFYGVVGIPPGNNQLVTAGVITLGAGAALGVIGAILLGSGGSTSLELQGGREGTRAETPMVF